MFNISKWLALIITIFLGLRYIYGGIRLKINEEVVCKLLVLLCAQYEEINKMVMNKEEINIMTLPKVQGTPLLNLINKLSYLENEITNIKCVNDLVEKVEVK